MLGPFSAAIAAICLFRSAFAQRRAQISHAYTADVIDAAAAKQALAKSREQVVRALADRKF